MKLSFIVATLLCFNLQAQTNILVSAEKISLDKDQTVSDVDVIDAAEIEASGESSLVDLLANRASLYINSNGGFAKATSLFLRGADSSYTLIEIDGVEYNDRSSVGGAAILEHIDLSNIEKVEILKGAQSVLYGSDAMAGVIKITTKTPGKYVGANASIGYGSYDNKRASFSTSQKGKTMNYVLGMSFQDVEGFSSYNEKRAPFAERDGMNNLTATFKGVKKLGSTDQLMFNVRGVKAQSDFDASTSDKLDYMGRDEQLIAGVSYKKRIGDYWIPELSITYNKSDRLSNSFSLSRLVAETKKVELKNPLYINESITILNGLEYEDIEASIENINNKKNYNSYATYLDSHLQRGDLKLQAGLRWSKEKSLSDQIVWKGGASYRLFENTFAKLNASTGYKSPSLYQLFSIYGNEQLRATKSKSYDFTLEQRISAFVLSGTIFQNEYENVIDFDSTLNKYTNTFKSETKGVELGLDVFTEKFDLSSSATILRAFNKSAGSDGVYLARRPREKYYLGLKYKFNEKLSLSNDYNYVGRRENSDFDTVVLSSYLLVGLNLNYEISNDQAVLLKIDNALDKEYEQIHGFGTAGRSFFLRYNFKL
ncbi:TonB-dependent receptor plug domain-containing protein [Halobacteriovorax marinus]|uniref:TonB-dependent receptor plug domain-containing protein n=1 Tax=Halobacteriovorax marinus TaxID=97084 RepID=UPI003A912F32